MKINPKLTAEEILETEFLVELKGYRIEEVDDFLDTIRQDYILFTETLKILESENQMLQKENQNLLQEKNDLVVLNKALKSESHAKEIEEVSNGAFIKRIANIEKLLHDVDKNIKKMKSEK
ncbi:DivIVA domain-containing protein [Mesoplasma syrphidae]|uniref:DivIVA domain-containing protein n=1 Tax=Mesoplasma syrphidae TaxID=225999 RepID=A0A2K9BKA6_9MOLU|nr:DivIVA domain-containing protein [Mesoplasma syrphidae]AUF83661.1 DivIVA domain-containing protein [Mesoplasma syrphidae]